MTTPTQVGWVDERGILFPLSAYNPERASQYDAHKAGWKKAYTLDESAQPFSMLTDEQILSCMGEKRPVRQHHGAAVFEYRLFGLIDFARAVLKFAAPAPEQNYAKCYVCDRPMDGKSEDDCNCFHRRELAPETVSVLARVSDSLVSELTGYRPEQLLTEREATSIRERGQARWNQLIAIANNATLAAPVEPLPPAALEAARAFGAGLDAASIEQPSEVV